MDLVAELEQVVKRAEWALADCQDWAAEGETILVLAKSALQKAKQQRRAIAVHEESNGFKAIELFVEVGDLEGLQKWLGVKGHVFSEDEAQAALQTAIVRGDFNMLEFLLSKRFCTVTSVTLTSVPARYGDNVAFAKEFARLVGRWVPEETVADALPKFYMFSLVTHGNDFEMIQEHLIERFDLADVDLEQTIDVFLGEAAYVPFEDDEDEDEAEESDIVGREGYDVPLVKHVITGSARARLEARRKPWTPDTHKAHSAPTRARLRTALIALTLKGHLPSSVVIECILPQCIVRGRCPHTGVH